MLLGVGLWTPAWAQGDPAQVGEWSERQAWPDFAIHAHLLPTGKVAFWSDVEPYDVNLWDPATNTFSAVAGPGYIHYCSGHSFLANGHLFVAGGHVENNVGLPNASIFDPFTETWSALPDMNAGRWYPTATTLSSGDVVVVSGDIDPVTTNFLPQVWQTATSDWRDLTDAIAGGTGLLYPWLFVAPNGQVFLAGHDKGSKYLNTDGTGAWTFITNAIAADRDYGSAVMYAPGIVLIMGGDGDVNNEPPRDTAEVIDLNQVAPTWRAVGSLSGPRRQLNATLLPDGSVLVTGGSSATGFNNAFAPVFHAELWDPVTETWTTMASNSIYRGYHSVALLLPDGRVVTAGGTRSFFANAEFFSPPYLFRGPQPTIATARSAVTYNQTFFVGTPDAADIARVTWVRLSSVTHAFNQNQRFNELDFAPTEGGVEVTTPLDGALAPPGHYLLFLLNADGVPSIGKITRIEAADPVLLAPAAPLDLAATAVSGTQIDLTWTDTASDEEGFLIERSLDGANFLEAAEAGANATSYSDLGLSVDTTYHYRVRAYNLAGESAFSNTASDRTPAVPVAPSGLTATAVSTTQINLAWTDNATNEVSYRIERSPDGSAFAEIASAGANATQYMDAGLTVGATRHYRVRAANEDGFSDFTNTANARTFRPFAEISATSLSFGSQHLGTTSAARNVTLTSNGEASLSVSSISETGDFSPAHNCPASLAPSTSCTIQTTFSPTATGARSGTLTVAHNAVGSPLAVSLSGSGTHFFFSVATGDPTTLTVNAGSAGVYRLTIVPDGFQGTLSFNCTGAPAGATCAVSPNPAAVDGSTPVVVTVTVTTTARSQAVPFEPGPPPDWVAPVLLVGLLAWFVLYRAAPARRWATLAAMLLLLVLVSCGGGGGSSFVPRPPTPPPTSPPSGTPSGTSTITVAGASGNLTSSITLTLTVN